MRRNSPASVRVRTVGDGPIPAGRGIVPGQVAEIIVALDGGPGRRGSGYRVGPTSVLTAAHVIEGAASVRVRFDADLPGEWVTEATPGWVDPRSDLAVLSITPREGEPSVAGARFGRIGGDRAVVLAAQAMGFPRFKLKTDDGVENHLQRYRDSHQADGSVAVLSNRREGTLELTVPPPERDPDPVVSPWEGMSGAAVWVGNRIVGVIANHHRSDGLGRLAAARLDLTRTELDQQRQAELRTLLGLPDVLPDVVPSAADQWVTTAYQAQVRDIAPDNLLERGAELDELVEFCAGDQPYAWWQAGPWAGKSALMAWFVLHPPAGVDVVSFFVTARLAGQSDSDASTDALIEQLAALVDESPAGLPTAGARRGTMLRLLEDAASRSREAGRRLLLVIDGLDEDCSGSGRPSIAALLPRRPPPEVRVMVASRPHPPIPDDVTGDHPLRTVIPRNLAVSEYARDVETRAKHELVQLLTGQQLQRDVLGLITGAGGGLTQGDLEALTQEPPYEIGRLLGGVFGRSVASRAGSAAAGQRPDERVYLFAHETLRLVAEQQYGDSLAGYRARLHDWAGTWRHQGWPADTPQYLLRSYPSMLARSGDLPRLVACATDEARHDRMRDLTGGDAMAFTEISTTQQLILAQPEPDLAGLALLAVQRERLTDRNSDLPIELPAVWARIGHLARAEALAHSIPDPDHRTEALADLSEVLAGHNEFAWATRLAGEAELLTGNIADPDHRVGVLARLAEVAAAGGDLGRAARLTGEAELLTGHIADPDHRARALARLAEAVAAGGDLDGAARLADAAEILIGEITGPSPRLEALARLAEAVAIRGDIERAARLAGAAESLLKQIVSRGLREGALARLAGAVATAGDPHHAHALTEQVTEPNWRAEVLARLAEVRAGAGAPDRAAGLIGEGEALTGSITDPYLRLAALARLAEASAAGGDLDRANRLAGAAEALTEQITDPDFQVGALTRLAEVVAKCGDLDWATRLCYRTESVTGWINDPNRRLEALTLLAEALARGGDQERAAGLAGGAEALTVQITDPNWRVDALTRLTGVLTRSGRHEWAARLAGEAEALTEQITDPSRRVWMLTWLAKAVAECGAPDWAARLTGAAEALTAQLTNPYMRLVGLAHIAERAAAAGDGDRATRLTSAAERLVPQVTDPSRRVWALARLAETAAVIGDIDWALRLAGNAVDRAAQTTDMPFRVEGLAALAGAVTAVGELRPSGALVAQVMARHSMRGVLARLVAVVAACGDHERAEAFTARITDPHRRADALACLAATLVDTNVHTPRDPVPARARRLLAEALATGSWITVVSELGRIDPPAVRALVNELQLRWNQNDPGDSRRTSNGR